MALTKVYSRTRDDFGIVTGNRSGRGLVLEGKQVEEIMVTKDTGDTSGNVDLSDVQRPNKVLFLPIDKADGTEDTGDVATGNVLIAGASGSIDSITVGGVEIMSGAEAFDTDLPTTAEAIKDNIVAHTSSPNYTATRSGNNIIIAAITTVENHEAVNGFAVVTTGTTMTATDTDMANGRDPDYEEVTFAHVDNNTITLSSLGTWTRALLKILGRSYKKNT